MSKKEPNFESLLASNSKSMQHFYSLPTDKRQMILDNICRLNSAQEINEYLDDFSWQRFQ